MRRYKKRIISLFFVLYPGCQSLLGQNMTIKSVSLQPNDYTAIQQLCLDNNGDTCALLKIKTDNLEGLQFSNPNQYIKYSYSEGIYSVYVPALSRKLDFRHSDFMPIQIDMADYGYKRLRKGKTYLITLEARRASELKSTAVIKVTPVNSTIVFDNKEYHANINGTLEIPVVSGNHKYSVVLDNYNPVHGSITIGKSEVKTLNVNLIPYTQQILIKCNVENARVFVDNIDYGEVGNIIIPHGKHKLRVQAEGHLDEEKEVQINSTTNTTIQFVLKENRNVRHIHAVPVTIFAPNSNSIYKNNKKIDEWTNGAAIKFMPGKYMISDDRGRTYKLLVGNSPMTITL